MNVTKALKDYRDSKGTNKAAADALGIPYRTFTNWISRGPKQPSKRLIEMLIETGALKRYK